MKLMNYHTIIVESITILVSTKCSQLISRDGMRRSGVRPAAFCLLTQQQCLGYVCFIRSGAVRVPLKFIFLENMNCWKR